MPSAKKFIVPVTIAAVSVTALLVFSWSREVRSDRPQVRTEAAESLKKGTVRLAGNSGAVYAYPFAIRTLAPEDDYYHLPEPAPLIPKNTPLDEQGVPVFLAKDQKLYNHPVRLAHHAINFVNSYRMTGKQEYLDKAKLLAGRLNEIAVHEEDRMYFPYEFDVYLHNIPTEHLKPRWYSGMAQGQALSAFSRLYQVTKDPKYLEWAEKTFNSLTKLRADDGRIWVSMVDDKQYFWIEEYPADKPTRVLNGYIFAIFGLYDYYQVKKTKPVKNALLASLTTVHDHIHLWRVPGDVSRYGLKHDHQSESYHMVHIDQLDVLYKMTGAPRFREMRELFLEDWTPEKGK